MPKYKRIIILIMDSVGCGAQKDHKKYHRQKCNTLLSVYRTNKNFHLPNLEKMGLDKILFNRSPSNNYCAGKITVKTAGNDTLASTWEIMGIIFKQRYRSLQRGFNQKMLKKIERILKIPVIGNEYIASHLAFKKFFNEHQQTGLPILSLADDGGVLLLAHEKIISPQRLFKLGQELAHILEEEKEKIARVIVRPFYGNAKGGFKRRIKDKHFPVISNMVLIPLIYYLKHKKIRIYSTEHIYRVLGEPKHMKTIDSTGDNKKSIKNIIKTLKNKTDENLVLISCLQDFDGFGHKKDPIGYGKKLKEFDHLIPTLTRHLTKKDLLIITSDHGCDPTLDIRGHTRENVPLMIYRKNNDKMIWLKDRKTLADIGQTICYNYSLPSLNKGKPIQELF